VEGSPVPNNVYRERHLPHQVPSGFPIFLNWNLKGAVPRQLIDELEDAARQLKSESRLNGESDHDRKIRHAKLLFARRDLSLDRDSKAFYTANSISSYSFENRSMWLAAPSAACEVAKAFLWGVETRYQLWAFVVMGNHVHSLLTPNVDLEIVTQGIKGFTAYTINKMQNATGRIFWQDESYDHWARDDAEFFRIIKYIEQNPVVAGLCEQEGQWIWSSAWLRGFYGWRKGEPFPSNKKEEAKQQLERALLRCRTSGFPA
jgi:type I restriction enzyme R subunit